MTPVELYHLELRDIGCIACLMQLGKPSWPVAIHHLFDPSQRDDWLVVALCEPGHHQHGKAGIIPFHPGGERRFRNTYGFGEVEMLKRSIEEVMKVQFFQRALFHGG